MDEEEDREYRGIRTMCQECNGNGSRLVPRMSASGPRPDRVGTLFAPFNCKQCDGTGWINGF